ncbi:surfeit locus protein 1 isoform X2 [Phoenix dactylifera]|uniref:SURF1-like protein n=1 Tax=Phoenix dactylifera TaxID=42345 RepID=A0A8B7CR56_PHODC|nr:surfeit locus protein 1 isoform X2 [Phoenix dactylifera]
MAASLSKTLRLHRLLLSKPRNWAPVLPLSAFSASEATLRPPPPPPSFASVAGPSASQAPEKERGRWSKLLLFLPGAITFGLGTWQLFRRQEKIEMLDYRRKRLETEPIMWNEIHSLDHDVASSEFRRVICEGYFDETKSIYVGPRSRSISGVTENGYYVITPLIPRATDPGSLQLPILVNRGWVPRGWRDNLEESQNVERASNLGDAKQTQKKVWWKFWSKSPAVSKVLSLSCCNFHGYQANKAKEDKEIAKCCYTHAVRRFSDKLYHTLFRRVFLTTNKISSCS